MSRLEFPYEGTTSSGKTKIWRVCSRGNPLELGKIAWYAHWRKYVFEPNMHTVFDSGCLRDIADFCESKTMEHKHELS